MELTGPYSSLGQEEVEHRSNPAATGLWSWQHGPPLRAGAGGSPCLLRRQQHLPWVSVPRLFHCHSPLRGMGTCLQKQQRPAVVPRRMGFFDYTENHRLGTTAGAVRNGESGRGAEENGDR